MAAGFPRSCLQPSAISPLRYPGKIASDLANGRLFVSDSNNHRIVITDLTGNFLEQIGGEVSGSARKVVECEGLRVTNTTPSCHAAQRRTQFIAPRAWWPRTSPCHPYQFRPRHFQQMLHPILLQYGYACIPLSVVPAPATPRPQHPLTNAGNGPALKDGSFEAAALNRPQGLVFSPRRNQLFIADTENHAVSRAGVKFNAWINAQNARTSSPRSDGKL